MDKYRLLRKMDHDCWIVSASNRYVCQRTYSNNRTDILAALDRVKNVPGVPRIVRLVDPYVITTTLQNGNTALDIIDVDTPQDVLARVFNQVLTTLIDLQDVGLTCIPLRIENVLIDSEGVMLHGVAMARFDSANDLAIEFALFVYQVARECWSDDMPPSLEYLVNSALDGATLEQLRSQPFLNGKKFLTL